MVTDEDTQMADVAFPASSAFKGKGKGKATQHDHPADNDNLPWYFWSNYET